MIASRFLSNENRSRNWRKKNLLRFSTLQHNSIVITGHTQTDRLERNLNNLIRGTSSKGVSSLNSFRQLQETSFNKSYLVFSMYFISLRLLTQPKQVKNKKKIKLKSKLFFSKANIFDEKSVSPVLEIKYIINSTIDNSESFNHYSLSQKPRKLDQSLLKHKNQSRKVQKKITNFSVWKTEKTKFSGSFQQKKLFCRYFCNGSYIKTSQSFCFSKFSEKTTINLKSPLQNHTRVIVSKVAKIYNLPIFHDLTNFSSSSSRNKIRHITLPVLGYLFQKKIDFSLTQFFSTVSSEISECENFSRKFYFLLMFFSISSVCYPKRTANPKNFPNKILKAWVISRKETQAENFEFFLLMYLCRTSDIKIQPSLIKKLVSNYTERELSSNQLRNIQKSLI